MSNEKNTGKNQIDWHTGFEGGLRLCFKKYRDVLMIQREYPLSRQPLQIDFIVAKKEKDVVIDNDIGRLFKMHNIMEFKNPHDDLNSDVLWKVIGYAGIYKSLGEKVNAIPQEEMTIFIFRSTLPVKLFKQLRQLGHDITLAAPGIYSIHGVVGISLYIIVSKNLTDTNLRALKIMTKNANTEDVKNFVMEAGSYTEPEDRRNAKAVIQLIGNINSKLVELLKEGDAMRDVLSEIMADDLKQAEDKGMEKRDIDKISEMLGLGRKPEDIAEFCNYPLKQVLDVQKKLQSKAKA